jgi:hypothetical protein
MLHVLDDGTRLRLRFIEPGDKALLAEGLRQLSPRSRRERFLAPKSVLSQATRRCSPRACGSCRRARAASASSRRSRS